MKPRPQGSLALESYNIFMYEIYLIFKGTYSLLKFRNIEIIQFSCFKIFENVLQVDWMVT